MCLQMFDLVFFQMNEAEIRSVFEQYGTVKEVKVITDRTGVSKGCVEYE